MDISALRWDLTFAEPSVNHEHQYLGICRLKPLPCPIKWSNDKGGSQDNKASFPLDDESAPAGLREDRKVTNQASIHQRPRVNPTTGIFDNLPRTISRLAVIQLREL